MINVLIVAVSAERSSISVRAALDSSGPVINAPIIEVDIPHKQFATAQEFRKYLESYVRAEVLRRKEQTTQIPTIVTRLTPLIGNVFQIEDIEPTPPPPPPP